MKGKNEREIYRLMEYVTPLGKIVPTLDEMYQCI